MAEAQSHKAFPKETTLNKSNIITKGRLRSGLKIFFTLAWMCCRPKAITEIYECKGDVGWRAMGGRFETSGPIKIDNVMITCCSENCFTV